MLEQLIAHYNVSYKDGGQWIMHQFMGFLAGVLFTPSISARFGKRNTVLFAVGVLALAEAAYSLLLPWGWMLTFAPLAGLGFGMTEAIVGAMIIELTKDGKASAMSRLETFFGIGALIIPLAAAYLIQHHIWQLAFPILAAMAAIIFVMWLTLSFGKLDHELMAPPREGSKEAAKQQHILEQNDGQLGLFGYSRKAYPFLIAGALFFMIYVGMEMSFSNYLPAILIGHANISETAAASSLSLFWGAVVVGRLFSGVLADRMGYTKYLLIATVASLAVFSMMNAFDQFGIMLLFIALSGLFFAGLFGIALVYANSILPAAKTERTTSLLVAFGGAGGALFPRMTGWMMDQYSITATLWYLTGLILLLLTIFVIWMMLGRKYERRRVVQQAPTLVR